MIKAIEMIIISENILQRNEAGEPPPDAVVNGTRQVFPPVLITLVCTFAAFLPMLFMKGTIGKFIYIIPLSISLVLFISLLESIFLLPASLVKKWGQVNIYSSSDRVNGHLRDK
jgi:multidrug efflux pump subunit AcrB